MFQVFSLGSDPEFILTKDGKPKSAIGLNLEKNGVKAYADNVLMEISHQPFSVSDFATGIRSVVSTASELANQFNGCSFTIGQCEGLYEESELSSPEAHEIGCQPFFNAYDVGVASVPKPYTDRRRHAGGHIHIAYDTDTFPPHMLVQLLDERLLPLDPNYGKTSRSYFYGAKGAFRYKPYGIEYRPTSNWWLSNPEIIVDVIRDIETYINKTYYGA